MPESADLQLKVNGLEAKVKKLELATLSIVIIFILFFMILLIR